MISALPELCREHGYPDELRDVLLELDAAARTAFPGLESLVLSGSISTGDFVWRHGEHGVELLSDIDAQLFADPSRGEPDLLLETIRDLERRHPFPLFQIDLAISPPSALRGIPSTFQMAEIRRAGFILSGRDVRGAFPEHFDPRASRQAFLLNLWKPLLHWAPASGEDDTLFALAAARLFLDLPLLVASEAGSCVPGHRRRADAYLAAPDAGLVVPCGPEAVAWALELRAGRRAEGPDLARRVCDFAFQVVAALDGLGPPPREPDAALVRRLSNWLPRRSVRRVGGELRSLLRSRDRSRQDLAWLLSRKEALGGAALLGILAYLPDVEAVSPAPAGVAALLETLSGRPAPRGIGIDFVYEAKNAYWEGLKLVYPAVAKKESGIARFLRQAS